MKRRVNMRNKLFSFLTTLVIIVLTTVTNCYAVDFNAKSEMSYTGLSPQGGDSLYGSKAAKADTNLTLDKMLTYSIEDEYLARAYYSLVIEKFGEILPFSNIIKSEELHIMAVKSLFPTYKLSIPSDKAEDYMKAPVNIKEALEVSEQIEIENIAMYERFLKENPPEDVKEIFTGLRNSRSLSKYNF